MFEAQIDRGLLAGQLVPESHPVVIELATGNDSCTVELREERGRDVVDVAADDV